MTDFRDRFHDAREHLPSVAPHRWTGEPRCLVGPFSAEDVARQFEHYVVHRGGITTSPDAVRELQGGWYVAVPGRASR